MIRNRRDIVTDEDLAAGIFYYADSIRELLLKMEDTDTVIVTLDGVKILKTQGQTKRINF